MALEECIDPERDLWHIRADVQPAYNDDGERQGVSYWEEELDHQPTEEDWAAFNAAVETESTNY